MNRVPRVYLSESAFADHVVRPGPEASHYLNRVLRLKAGDRWAALDGERRSWLCEVVDKETSRKVETWEAVPPLPVAVEVGLALCKGSRFEDALEKLAELGVVRAIPLETERTERGLPSPAKLLRWDQIAKSGSALANRLVPMQVAPATSIRDFLGTITPTHAIYCHSGGSLPSELLLPHRSALTFLIGPEGGFSPAELEALQSKARRMSLGPLTLRVETAAVCAVTLALELCRPR